MALMVFLPASLYADSTPATCTYRTYKWNVHLKQAVDRRTVTHAYRELKPYEIDPDTGCTVCEEDQVKISTPRLGPFHVCRIIAPVVQRTLQVLQQQGEPFYEIVGYRVGMTRGDVDHEGNRTRFSNHSFGVALDINPQQNGLYDRCIRFGPHCRLIRGGHWRPQHLGALTHDGKVVRAMRNIGLRWGGEIAGKQKDFMHFSPSGY